MIELSRTIRFCLNGEDTPGEDTPGEDTPGRPARSNTYSAWPPIRGLGRYYACAVRCRGEVDTHSGYFINTKRIDEAFREHVLPWLETLTRRGEATSRFPFATLMREIIDRLQPPLGQTVHEVAFHLTPFVSLIMRSHTMDRLTLRQEYEFAAAHRLHAPQLSEEENQRLFGKCNHPSGHGHNYRVAVNVSCPVGDDGHVTAVEQLDDIVDAHVLQKLDHKNLNVDVEAFREMNTSVENISKVIYRKLAEPVRSLGEGVELEEVSVWETNKTVCTYRGPDAANDARGAAGSGSSAGAEASPSVATPT